ncbi:hypothetical protein JOD21_001299 [Jeotgalibacillus terrae]|uniref:Nucleotidyltransferase domain-containing protein n=2 Tax=Jeotgalibacillus terrae TaxID=587735 RepID=A0ABW5ZGX4_9BACL|nr:hypothetical protein [Jeotgalibacillus terrae]MBM7578639.1 hypothetical protein [Jeotgalibacillus terrae]
MQTDHWKSSSVNEIQILFQGAHIQWWIAGGWALDLYLGCQTREHSDIDVVILRDDHLTLHDYLRRDWELFKAHKGELIPWKHGESLPEKFDNIWVKKSGELFWSFQVMILDTEDHQWIYKRHRQIRRSLQDIGLESADGVPYLKPDIQLLYKGGSSVIREKDLIDFERVCSLMDVESCKWLKNALLVQFPEGHQWVDRLDERMRKGST